MASTEEARDKVAAETRNKIHVPRVGVLLLLAAVVLFDFSQKLKLPTGSARPNQDLYLSFMRNKYRTRKGPTIKLKLVEQYQQPTVSS